MAFIFTILFTPLTIYPHLLFTPIYYLPPFTIYPHLLFTPIYYLSIYPHLLFTPIYPHLPPFTIIPLYYFSGIKTHRKSFRGCIVSSKHYQSMSKMNEIRNSYVELEIFEKFASNTRQHYFTKFGKKPKIVIFRCLKNHFKIKIEI